MLRTNSNLVNVFWESLNQFRGVIEFNTLKKYLITLVFLKYLTENSKANTNFRFSIPKDCDFDSLLTLVNNPSSGHEINRRLNQIANENLELEGLINYVDFNQFHTINSSQKVTEILGKLIILIHASNENIDFRQGNNISFWVDLFDYIMQLFADNNSKSIDNFSTPKSVNDIIAGILGIDLTKKKITIYDPTCGLGNTLITAAELNKKDITLFGQEWNYDLIFEAKLNLLIHGFYNFHLEEDDVLNNPKFLDDDYQLKKFDYVVANPPFSLRKWNNNNFLYDPYNRWNETTGVPPNNNADFAFILHILASLKVGGRAVTTVSNGILFKAGNESSIRRYLIDNGFIKCIIGLPGNLYSGTSIPSCIIVLENNSSQRDIFFIDASNDFVKDRFINKITIESVEQIINTWSKELNINEFSRLVSYEEIVKNDYNLNIARYLFSNSITELLLGHDMIKLGNLATIISGSKSNSNEVGKLIKTRDLKDSNLEYTLNVNNIAFSDISKNLNKIQESCLLISMRWKSIKPTYFRYEGIPIFITNDIIAIKVNELKIDIDYLINEFYAEYVLNQIESFRTGTIIPALKKVDLLSIKISVPSLAEQKAKIEGVKEAFIQSKKVELHLQQELLGIKDESFREFASIKHTFRQYLNALQSNVAGTKKFISNNAGNNITLEMTYSKNLNKTFGEHLSSLEGTINSMSKMLSSFENANNNVHSTKLNLLLLVTEAQNRFKNTDLFKFEKVYADTESFTMFDDTVLEPIVSFNEDDFYVVYSNIISNAIDHGFKDNSKKYSVRTSISFDDKEKICVLEVSNNGDPMPKDFTLNHLTTRGEKTTNSNGTGMGGAEIKTILNKYNGTLDILNLEKELFPVSYILKIPYHYENVL